MNVSVPLTPLEHRALELSADLAATIGELVGDGPSRDADMAEMGALLHGIQRAIAANAAARAYPDLFRLLGGTLQ